MAPNRAIQSIYDRETLGPEYQKALHTPKPELGWKGDPDLTLTWHRLYGWEVWREEAYYDYRAGKWVQRHQIIARQRVPKERFNINALLQELVARDTTIAGQSHSERMEEYIKAYEQEEAQKEKRFVEALAPARERVYWAMAKDSGVKGPTFISRTVVE